MGAGSPAPAHTERAAKLYLRIAGITLQRRVRERRLDGARDPPDNDSLQIGPDPSSSGEPVSVRRPVRSGDNAWLRAMTGVLPLPTGPMHSLAIASTRVGVQETLSVLALASLPDSVTNSDRKAANGESDRGSVGR
jgi:hypothetical protein